MKVSYQTSGSCASRIEIEIEDGVITETKFIDGCAGNTQAVAALVRGMEVNEAIRRLKGIARGTPPAQTNWHGHWSRHRPAG